MNRGGRDCNHNGLPTSDFLHLCSEGAGVLIAGEVGGAGGRSSSGGRQEGLCCSAGVQLEQTAASTRNLRKAGQRSAQKGAIFYELV